MKMVFLMALTLSTSAWAMDPAAQFVDDAFAEAVRVMSSPSASARTAGMCRLLRNKLSRAYIAQRWLGRYASLTRDAAAAREFQRMIPGIILGKAFGRSADSISGSYSVNPTARARGNGYYGVSVRVSGKGKSYSGTAVVLEGGGRFYLVDGEYIGFSAVNYAARDFKKKLDAYYNRNTATSKPITDLIHELKSNGDYIGCG